MKNLVLYDPDPIANEYLTKIYFQSLQDYARDHGNPIPKIASLEDVGDSTVITHGDYLVPENIRHLKENNNKIVSFDINDSSWLVGSYRFAKEVLLIDKIYKLSGLQKTNISKDFSIDSDFTFSLVDKTFLLEEAWNDYRAMVDRGSLFSLPYVPWQHQAVSRQLSYVERSGKILSRGGNHFGRFMVFLFLMMYGKADSMTSFATADYFRRDMNPQFKFCAECIADKEAFGALPYHAPPRWNCNSPAPWGNKLDLSVPNLWNNRCPRSFFWLCEKFNEKYGAKDARFVEKVLNGRYESGEQFMQALSQATAYSDLKWIFSIYIPPRFWEAASCSTVNFLPARTNDQAYFPHVEEGAHYLTFQEDFKDFDPNVSQSQFTEMTRNSLELYETWIKPSKYRISSNLSSKIFSEIEEIANAN